MWKLFNRLFGWDYVLIRFCHSWKVKKVTWFHNDAFCTPCMGRDFINNSEHTDGLTAWKPLTYNMFKYKMLLAHKELTKIK